LHYIEYRQELEDRRRKMFGVISTSRTAITKKVAEEIRNELRVTHGDVETAYILPEDSSIFISTGCYGLGRYCSLLKKRAY
jgi:hypothetical protein